jgi:hypothetical protein
MEIQFQTTKLERRLTHASMLRRKYGALAPKIYQRIAELRAMRNLDVPSSMPALRCHELAGLRSGQLAFVFLPITECSFVLASSHRPSRKIEGLTGV